MVEPTQSNEVSAPRRRLVPVLLAGGYAFSLTVLPTALPAGVLSLAGLSALLALSALVASVLLPPGGRLAMVAALDAFLGLSFVSVWAGGEQTFDYSLAAFGAFGWLAYALAIGSLSTPGRSRTTSSSLEGKLHPRTPPSRGANLVLGCAIVGALLLMASPWLVQRPALAVFGHVFALAAVLLVFRTSAQLATYLQARGTSAERPPNMWAARLPLFALTLLLVGGLVQRFVSG